MNEIYDLKLHNHLMVGHWEVTRVPGGWIYRTPMQGDVTSVFVPYVRK